MISTMAVLATIVLQQPPVAVVPAPTPPALATQVMLDRAGFSPGAIDGRMGPNTRRALEAFQKHRGVQASPSDPPLTTYIITTEDVQGPFVPSIPEDMVEKARLPALGYRSVIEALSERFHTTPALIEQLNPGIRFEEGVAINVPNVVPFAAPAQNPDAIEGTAPENPTGTSGAARSASNAESVRARPNVIVTVRARTSDLTVTDEAGQVLLYAPVTTGSTNDPLPIGEWKVNGVQFNPTFHYNPDLFWDADPSHSKAIVPPGPNNPVGFVWIDISKPHYGIHGTPEPTTIGRTESHGCIRLTNWDAVRLAGLVKPGTKVVFAQ